MVNIWNVKVWEECIVVRTGSIMGIKQVLCPTKWNHGQGKRYDDQKWRIMVKKADIMYTEKGHDNEKRGYHSSKRLYFTYKSANLA